MHTHDKWLLEETWQRVVDNELTAVELNELISACERSPELWQRCAMAFLQEQALGSELKGLAADWQHSEARSRTHLPSCAAQRATVLPLAGPARSSLLNSLAFAASVMLAFLVGWQASRRLGGNSDRLLNRGVSQVEVGGTRDPLNAASLESREERNDMADMAAPTRPEHALSSSASAPNNPADKRVEDARTWPDRTTDATEQAWQPPNQFVLLDTRLPKQLAELEERGLVRIESTEGFVSVLLNDGNTAVVPVQQFDVRSIGFTY